MRHNPYISVLITLSFMLMAFMLFSGCKKETILPPAPKDATTAKKVNGPAVDPFQDTARKTVVATAGLIADTARVQPSAIIAEHLGRLHVSGFMLIIIALLARVIFGRWKDAYIASGLGLGPSVLAVLLTDYSRVVLLVPLCGLVLLIVWGIRKTAEWRTKAQGFDATSTIIEKADTGPKSLGQLMKDRIAETPVSGVIDKALTYMEALWAKAK